MWFEFLLVVALLELTPGPNMAWLATLTLDRGKSVGLQAVLGISLGFCLYLAAALAGLGVLMASNPRLLAVLRWLGVMFLFYMAIEPWWERAKQHEQVGTSAGAKRSLEAGRYIIQGLTLNIFNPKVALFYVTLLPRFVVEERGLVWAQSLWLGLIHIGVATGVHVAIVLAAGRLRPWLGEGRRGTELKIFFTVALVLIAVWLAWDGLGGQF
ncbi:threonine transporter RhtB [Candidatus Phycosocius spiralis]|uniref:Threonine transporter RhtB n=2 Tax=Candidatus Phycosocius spiralis TaxID=2815099 RepID=A0ABQ4PW26_9PROT|nr:threonine transporter RhtB [Candidatus Phycosocius spiralis]